MTFVKGASGNPHGRPALPPEVKQMREECLVTSVRMMHEKLHDKKWMGKLKPHEFMAMIEVAFDRCGLPKGGGEGDGATNTLVRDIANALAEARAAGIIPVQILPDSSQPGASA